MTDKRNAAACAERLAALLRVQTVSERGQTDLSQFYRFHELLREMFPLTFAAAEVFDLDGSLLLRLPGGSRSPVMFMSHMDVVPAEGEWRHDPFAGEIAEGRVWGRGALDTKCNLWAIFTAVEQLLEDGYALPRELFLVSSRSEETDGSGAKAIAAFMLEQGMRPALLLDEGGMIVEEPISGVAGRYAMMGVAEKIICDVRFIARDGGGHASAPGRNTPLVRLGCFMREAERKKLFTVKVNKTTREMFRRMTPGMKGGMRALFGSMWLTKPLICKVLPSVSAAGAAMLRTTLAFTMAGGSSEVNVLPTQAYVVGDMRCSLHQGLEKSLAAVKKLAKRFDIEVEVFDRGDESPATDYKGRSFRAVERVINEVFPGVATVPYIMNGASDCRYYGEVCADRIRFAPFTVSNEQLDTMHAADENIDIETLPSAVEFFRRVIMSEF